MSPLILNSIGFPLGIGIVLGLVLCFRRAGFWLQTLSVGLAILLVYTLLEGLPPYPPVAAKQRLFYLILLAAPVAFLADMPAAAALRRGVVPAFLAVALLWLGLNKLVQPASWPASLLLLTLVAVAAISSPGSDAARKEQAFLWPVTLLVFAIGASILSLLGYFVGFAQMNGALAAMLGGALAVSYIRQLISGQPTVYSLATLRFLVMSLGAVALMVGLFAPRLSLVAFAVLSLTLFLPRIAPPLGNTPGWLRPVLFGLMAAIPALLAVGTAVLLTD